MVEMGVMIMLKKREKIPTDSDFAFIERLGSNINRAQVPGGHLLPSHEMVKVPFVAYVPWIFLIQFCLWNTSSVVVS